MPAKRPELVPALTKEELEQLDFDERRLEAWHLVATGQSHAAAGRALGVGATTISRWVEQVALDRRSRSDRIEMETERIIGTFEAVLAESWVMAHKSSENSMAGPSHMKNVLEAAKEIARLQGIGPTKAEIASGPRSTEVIVRIGGGRELPQVDVGVRERPAGVIEGELIEGTA